MDLRTLGWASPFEEAFAPSRPDGFSAGRVVAAHTGLYRVYAERGELQGEVSGKLRHLATGPQDLPAVGDWVVLRARAEEDRATIHAVLPRKSRFSRKVAGAVTAEQVVAANIDTVFLMMGLDGDFNPRRLERL